MWSPRHRLPTSTNWFFPANSSWWWWIPRPLSMPRLPPREVIAGAAHGHEREVVPVHVIVDHEAAREFAALRERGGVALEVDAFAEAVARESGAGVFLLVPSLFRRLRGDQPRQSPADGYIVFVSAGGEQ